MSSRYEIREAIGQGGLGSVYKAFDTQLQREVAIKRVLTEGQGTPEEIEAAGDKLIAEAQTLSSLNHPNIITVFDVGRDEKGGFVVMELLDGETLDETVERGVLTAEDFKEVVFQTMEGLITAQARDVIHRDIKPTNIMLIWQASGRFQLKILDFGLAKFSKNPSVQTMDQDEAVMGSIFFMAPEQFERTELDSRTDLYQMGCVYYNALTGQYPFNGETAPQVMNAHLQHKVVPLNQLRPDLPPVVSQWVMWLINRDISSRPTSAKEALQYFPKDLSAITSTVNLPGQAAVPAVAVVETNSPSVKIVTPSGKASAPPQLVQGGKPAVAVATPAVGGAPVVSSPTPASPGGYEAPPAKKGVNPMLVTGIICALIIGIVATFVGVKKVGEKKRIARFTEISEEESPSGSAKDVSLLVGFMTDPKMVRETKSQAFQCLIKLDGSSVDEAILSELKKSPSSASRKQLSSILSQRRYAPAVKTILNYAGSAKSADRISFLRYAQPLVSIDQFEEVLSGLKKASGSERATYESMLSTIVRSASSPRPYLEDLRTQVAKASGTEAQSLYRILGTLQDPETAKMVDKIFEGKDVAKQQTALSAYAAWPTREPLAKVGKIIESGDPSVARPANVVYRILSGKPGAADMNTKIVDWQKGFDYFNVKGASQTERVRLVQNVLMESPHPKTVALLNEWKNGPWKGQGSYERLVDTVVNQMQTRIKELPTIRDGQPLKGSQARALGNNASSNSFLESISGWTSPDTSFTWTFKNNQRANYTIGVLQADTNSTPSEFTVYVKGKPLKGKSKKTKNYEEFTEVKLKGTVTLFANSVYQLTIVAGRKTQPRMMDIGGVVFHKQ